MKKLFAQARAETLMTLRNGESLLVTMFIPAALLIFLVQIPLFGRVRDPASHYIPRVMAAAVIGSAMVSLGIATAFERHYKVLKRLGTTPLGRPTLLAAKWLSVMVVMALQTVLLLGAGSWLGWDPNVTWWQLAAALTLGAIAFAGIGMLLAGTLSAHLNLAVLNALFIGMLLAGGVIVEASALPGAMGQIAKVLPSQMLTAAFDAALNGGPAPWAGLSVWGAGTSILAAALFRWE